MKGKCRLEEPRDKVREASLKYHEGPPSRERKYRFVPKWYYDASIGAHRAALREECYGSWHVSHVQVFPGAYLYSRTNEAQIDAYLVKRFPWSEPVMFVNYDDFDYNNPRQNISFPRLVETVAEKTQRRSLESLVRDWIRTWGLMRRLPKPARKTFLRGLFGRVK